MERDIHPIVPGLLQIPAEFDTLLNNSSGKKSNITLRELIISDHFIAEAGAVAMTGMPASVATLEGIPPPNMIHDVTGDPAGQDQRTVCGFPGILKARGDLVFSILATILLIPVFTLIGIIIKLSSRGPVFFLQERIGFRGSKFKMIKFRTMVLDAEVQREHLKSMNEASGPVFKIKDDPRITRFGKFLRKNGLDELPQFINVIKGEMSLIGPRPPLEEEVRQYEPWQMRRLSVKPGITCTWQILPNRHSVPFDKWVKMDLHYIDHWSFRLDVALFFKTVKTFFLANGH